MKTPTPWSNNDVKAPNGWTPATKSRGQWATTPKNATQFTASTKNKDQWGPNTPANQSYFFDDDKVVFDSAFYNFDNMVSSNQINQRLVTAWSAT